MKHFLPIFLVFAALWVVSCGDNPVHIFMAGDSTMADKPLYKMFIDSITREQFEEENPERGWGQLLPAYFNDRVKIHNHARNGRSTRTFISEGRWQALLDSLQKGDYVVIQFGHNDQSKEKIDRYTSPEDYKSNMEKFVADVRAKKATPILCTPVMRRRFDTLGNFYDVHGVYPGLVRQVAEEQQALLSDMHRSTEKLLRQYGEEKSKTLFLHIPAGIYRSLPEGKTDNTHFNEQGANIVAALFIEDLKNLPLTDLSHNLK
ncbi:MAG: rhamnogalacturonan acetylesterase [Prevotellaceae bacterium]|jgi:lysophospholipase L1-like esterase|nr:rhamnogalacturonan acetylesterase [Prevotellaceae bacterium]